MNASTAPRRDDDWLERHRDVVAQAGAGIVLEIGCGEGRDTAWLCRHHHRVVAGDLSHAALVDCGRRAPAASRVRFDAGAPLPFADGTFALVVASLSLHYFGWDHTCRIVAAVRRCMAPAAHLICRLNSVRDVEFGARGHPTIERSYYRVRRRPKRFFARDDLDALFATGWERLTCEERTIDRYEKPKVAWELLLRKS